MGEQDKRVKKKVVSVVVERRHGFPAAVAVGERGWSGGECWGSVGILLRQQLVAHKEEREKRGKEGKRKMSGVIFFVSEGRSTHNPMPSFILFIYLFIYLFT